MKVFGVTKNELLSKNHTRRLVLPRHLCMSLMVRHGKWKKAHVAVYFNQSSNCCIIRALRNVDNWLQQDPQFRCQTMQVIERLKR